MTAPTPRFDFLAPPLSIDDLGRVHFVAIGGSGMSAVARILVARGVSVSGSDRADSAALRALADLGATVTVGHDASNVEGADTLVISSAIKDDNVEVLAARAGGIPVIHRMQALAAAMSDRRRIAIAGANGKTTTTSLTAVVLDAAGRDPSFACGGVIVDLAANARWASGPEFVAEVDESDGSFLASRPDVAILTSVQPDHLDFYGTAAQVTAAYDRFVDTIAPDGVLVACADDDGARRAADRARATGRRVLTYGVADDATVRVTEVHAAYRTDDGFAASGQLAVAGVDGGRLVVAAPGLHNLQNATAAYVVAVVVLGADPAPVLSALRGFGGVGRRFEVVGQAGGVTVIDDYAHNPAKVAAVVRTAVDLVGRDRVHVVFQPHLYSRTRDFADGFGAALSAADDVVLLDIYGAREAPMPGVSSELIAEVIRRESPRTRVDCGPPRESVPPAIAARCRPGDVVLVVGAGDVTTLAPQLLAALEARS